MSKSSTVTFNTFLTELIAFGYLLHKIKLNYFTKKGAYHTSLAGVEIMLHARLFAFCLNLANFTNFIDHIRENFDRNNIVPKL